jgi:catechol 2,3-dioxygenase-like lactoylglutathione lyase family enzyme
MQAAELRDVIPILDVRDVEAALRFYVERLGFQIDFRYEEDPNNYAGVHRGGVSLHMQWQHEDHFRDATALFWSRQWGPPQGAVRWLQQAIRLPLRCRLGCTAMASPC